MHIKAVVLLSRMIKLRFHAEADEKSEWITSPVGEIPARVPSPANSQKNSFAPKGRPSLGKKLSNKLRQPLTLSIPNGPAARLHDVCSVCPV